MKNFNVALIDFMYSPPNRKFNTRVKNYFRTKQIVLNNQLKYQT